MNEEWTLDSGTVVQIARNATGHAVGIVAVGWNDPQEGWMLRPNIGNGYLSHLAQITSADMDELVKIWQEKPVTTEMKGASNE